MGKLEGLQFLKHNAIEEKACDLKRPFAFISYAHDEEDTSIVINVFQRLYDRGYNLWIDTANIPKNENSWKDAAQEALMNEEKTCKLALFFRSEESLIRKPILDELEMIKILKHIDRIITIDIWHEDGMTAKKYGQQLISRLKKKELKIYKDICEYVDPDNSAYRGQDVNHNLEILVNELAKELEKDGVMAIRRDSGGNPPPVQPETYHTVTFYSQGSLVGSQTVKNGDKAVPPEEAKREGYYFIGWSGAEDGSGLWDFGHDTVSRDMALYACWEKETPPVPGPEAAGEGYTYTIFGRPYSAGKREQGKLMYDAFAALTDKHPDKADALTKLTCVASAENVSNAGSADANPTYFRMCRKFTVGGRDYYVGTAYGFKAKLGQIKSMLKICGEKADAFTLISQSGSGEEGSDGEGSVNTGEGRPDDGGSEGGRPVDLGGNCFEYELWGTVYKAKSLADMMHNSFDALAERYPHKAEDMADDGGLTAVARKNDVDQKKLPASKLNYFQQKREHKAGGKEYYVSNRYNRDAGIDQIQKMFIICEGNSGSFKIVKMPEKKTKQTPGSGKEGIGTLI